MSHGSHYLTRIEGHGNIVIDLNEGKIKQCRWEVPEAPRFFEAMVRERMWSELHHITSRICGICSISHTLASVKATEAGFDVEISPQTAKLRKLAKHAENLQSHVLHVGYLVLPDLMGVDSVIPLASSHPEEVKTVIRLHRLGNEMSQMICGRTTHPQRIVPGGFTRLPTAEDLADLSNWLQEAVADLEALAGLIESVAGNFPPFERQTEYIALVNDGEYPLYEGRIGSSDGGNYDAAQYHGIVNEYVVPHSTAKYARHNRESYMVGALARFNLNAHHLSPMAGEAAESLGIEAPCCNPFMNNVSQLVECFHSIEDSIRLIDEILTDGLEEERFEVVPKAGTGVGAIEAPRGMLFHEYEYDQDGRCINANLVIPTNQNHGNIQLDLESLLPALLQKSEKEIELTTEMLVRAYDPCVSCSTHLMKVKFEG
ncbi:MAG: Ni/Fe hydrogenase subunit alpha [Planctomycetota bacterium]|jgi:coenzyme F420-reducing hydrogenase alpha subunit